MFCCYGILFFYQIGISAWLRTSDMLLAGGSLATPRSLLLLLLVGAWGRSLSRLDIALGRLVLAQQLLGSMERTHRTPCQILLDQHLMHICKHSKLIPPCICSCSSCQCWPVIAVEAIPFSMPLGALQEGVKLFHDQNPENSKDMHRAHEQL